MQNHPQVSSYNVSFICLFTETKPLSETFDISVEHYLPYFEIKLQMKFVYVKCQYLKG